MTKSTKIVKKRQNELSYLDDIFENFRREVETALRPLQTGFRFPSLFDGETRIPLCDMADKGDLFELHLEVPGIEKEKINVKATANSVEIAAEQSEKSEGKRKGYLYSERSHKSFYRRIPVPEEIVSSKIDASMSNGILTIKLPKKNPARATDAATKVEIK